MDKYTISNKVAEVVVSRTGGTILSFKLLGENIFYPWALIEDGKARGGCPICAPWFGSVSFSKEKHGYLRGMEAHRVFNDETNALTLLFQHGGVKEYPWTIFYRVDYFLINETLDVRLRIERINDNFPGAAPINPAFHPYFFGDSKQTSVVVEGDVFVGFSNNAIMANPKSNMIHIHMLNKKILMKLGGVFNPDSSRLALWSDAVEKYACVEPVFYRKELFDTIAGYSLYPGEYIVMSMELSLE